VVPADRYERLRPEHAQDLLPATALIVIKQEVDEILDQRPMV